MQPMKIYLVIYWVYRCRNIGMSEYWDVGIVGSLETNFNGWDIWLSEYWVQHLINTPFLQIVLLSEGT